MTSNVLMATADGRVALLRLNCTLVAVAVDDTELMTISSIIVLPVSVPMTTENLRHRNLSRKSCLVLLVKAASDW